jgi:hypothetical protein
VEQQADAVRRIDEVSTKSASQLSGEPKPGRLALTFGLVFPPTARFANEFIVKGGALRGIEGLKSAVNAWALSFATNAKRYEKHYADDTELKARARDFLG